MPDQNWDEVVFPHVLGRVFHATSKHGLQGIHAGGAILPRNPTSHSLSGGRSNWAAKKGLICLYDFRVERQAIDDHFTKCHPSRLGREQALLVLKGPALTDLIPNDTPLRELGNYLDLWLPEIEVWSASPISLASIEKIIRVRRVRPPPSEEFSFLEAVRDADRQATGHRKARTQKD
jgi:hypothetical protein